MYEAMKHGRKDAVIPDGTVLYTALGNVVPPLVVNWKHNLPDWPLLANDRLGDCVPAAALHAIQVISRWRTGMPLYSTDLMAQALYRDLGWNGMGEGAGVAISDMLTLWRDRGIRTSIGVDRINGFAHVGVDDLKEALWLAGPLILGLNLPLSARYDMWGSPGSLMGDNAPGSWGKHAVTLVAIGGPQDMFSGSEIVLLVSWGKLITADLSWLRAYLDEAWAVLHPDWLGGAGGSPSGLFRDFVVAELRKLDIKEA